MNKLRRAVNIAKLSLKFARVQRVTRHENGRRPETDSDHTVMLAVLACDMAPDGLDRGLIAQFAIVHDLVEAYAGDTQTLTIDAAERAAKAEREAAALEKLLHEFDAESWLGRTLLAYERQDTPEARYVRVMDKVTPKLTHLLNGCVAAKKLVTRDGFTTAHRQQLDKLTAEHDADVRLWPALELLGESMAASENAWGKDCLTAEEALALLDVETPLPVASYDTKGQPLNANGEPIDPRKTVPWVWALGPFGSWPSTLEDAEADFARYDKWYAGESFRVGYAVVWKQGWGYAAKKPESGW